MITRNILEEATHWYSILLFYRFCANVDMVIMFRWMLYLHTQIKHILSIMKDERRMKEVHVMNRVCQWYTYQCNR